MNEKIINIAITEEQQEKVRKNSASSLPLNPTAQGWSAQKIREKLYRAICSDTGDLDDNLLDIIVDKLLSVKEVFETLQSGEFVVKKAELFDDGENGKSIELTFQGLENRMDAAENALLLKENKSEKGVANGYASLDSSAKIPTSQLPDSILGQLEYKGTFNPSNGYPVSPEKGWYYIANANALIGGVDYKVGDWAVYNGVSWDKIDNTDAVASVNGKTGVVVINAPEVEYSSGVSVKQKLDDLDLKKADKTILTNLVANGDFTLDSNSDGIPDGFSYNNATNQTLSGGVAKFTATEQGGRLMLSIPSMFNSTDIFYNFARVKSSRTLVGIAFPNGTINTHSGSGNFEFLSGCGIFNNIYLIVNVSDRNTSDWAPIEVDYMGAINITDLINRDILPSGLSNDEYKERMDALIKEKGFFQTIELNLMDVFNWWQKSVQLTADDVEYLSGVSVKQKLDDNDLRTENSFDNINYLIPTYEYHTWDTATLVYNTSTFSGFGWSIGKPNSVFSFEFQIQTRTTPFTRLRYYILKNNKNGEILRSGDVYYDNIEPNKKQNIIIDLINPIEDNLDDLYFMVQADQFIGAYNTGVDFTGESVLISYSTNGNFVLPQYMTDVENGDKNSLAFRVGTHIKHYSPKESFLQNTNISLNSARIVVPNEYVAVVGDKLQIFYRGIVEAVNPYNYDIFFKCSKGKAFTRYFEITPTAGDVGEFPIEIVVRDNSGKVLDSKTTVLKIITKKTSPATTKNLLCIGDSLTANSIYVTELRRRLVESGGSPVADGLTNINFIGTQGTSPNLHEGRAGWTWSGFTGSGSPFYNSGSIDFANYCSTNGFSGIDYVVFLLSWNGMQPNRYDATSHSVFINNAKILIDKLKEQYPNVKIILMGIQLPSLNGGMGYNYGAIGEYSENYGNVRSVFGLNLAYKDLANHDDYKDFVKHHNLSGQFDSEYNMPTEDVAVNSRSEIIEKRGSNGVHPKTEGYYQIADAVYRAIHDTI